MRTLLLVEDEADLVDLVRDLLPKWTIHHSESALDAAEWIRLNDPDVALLDYSMPGIRTGRLQKVLRVLHPELPWIYFTGRNDAEVIRRAIDENVYAFIEKPFDPDFLEAKLESALMVRRERRNLESRLKTLLPPMAVPLVFQSLRSCAYQKITAKKFKELELELETP
jgi:DNA-binding NtrC family response regulator